jgi:transcriptional regulator with XRE-family HTH domain
MKKKQDELDGLILTRNLTKGEQEKAKDELAEARRKIQAGLSEQERLAARILQFKLKLKEYFKKDQFDPSMRFSSCLGEYVFILNMKQRAFAREIDINETELSQLINKHRPPAEYLFIRLEIHSNNNIPANWWLKLLEKEREHHILTDKELRKKERKHVLNKLEVKV